MNGPRLYNSSFEDERKARQREADLKRRQKERRQYIHHKRQTTIIACFAILFVFFGVQIGIKVSQVHRLNQQVQVSKNELQKAKAKRAKLANKRDSLKEPDYVAKLLRSKFYYSKTNEKVYNLPDGKSN